MFVFSNERVQQRVDSGQSKSIRLLKFLVTKMNRTKRFVCALQGVDYD